MNLLNITPELWVENEGECLEYLNNDLQWNSIPLLNANDLQDLSDKKLVKFRGMIQDMFNPEYFYKKYEVLDERTHERSLKNGKYIDVYECKDVEVLDLESLNNVMDERQTLVVISMPGLNNWVEDIEKERFKIQSNTFVGTPEVSLKRTLELDDTTQVESRAMSDEHNKKVCINSANREQSTSGNLSHEHLLNFPFPERSGKSCQVKMYDNYDKIKINDMVEVVGFLSVDPILTNFGSNDDDNLMETQTHHPPPSLVPRIHCVSLKRIEHNNSLVDGRRFEVAKMLTLKKDLQIVLSQLFLGDLIAAEYFLCHLLSRVYLRNDLLPIGKFTLNISNVPTAQIPEYGIKLYEFIELLVPKSHYFPMTLENMNETVFIPKKDYECDRVTSGLLQLSNNTHLILDETKLTAGHLNEAGVRGVSALSNTIVNQRVTYDFQYYPMEFDCDIPFLILSEGKSLLPSDFHVCLEPQQECVNTFNEIVAAAKHFLKNDLLNDLRVYLTVARHGKYELVNDMQELVQNEFVRLRQEKNIAPDDLHQLLVLARLVCLSEGIIHLDEESWKKACYLEDERKKRL